jgi:hypothetical protein
MVRLIALTAFVFRTAVVSPHRVIGRGRIELAHGVTSSI